MANLSVTFLEKEYPIPSDVVTYVGLVGFTNSVRDSLITSFKQHIGISIDLIESDTFMLSAINEQVSKFIRKLLENDIYDRTANDYLHNNKGYELFLDTKKKVLRQLISIRQEKLETYKAGVEGALYRKEASVTGLDFGIVSNSFVNHMIYAYMDASAQTKQEQEALRKYNREIAELDKQAAEYDRKEDAYIQESVIPAMSTVFTYFAYELLDKYVSDLIKAGKFDKSALKFIDLERSNDLLGNINLANNKRAVIESAFAACPFNTAVYMHAMKLEMLDYDSFQAAKTFKQDSEIVSFLKESIGASDYPNFDEPNYNSASLLARYTNQSIEEILYRHTASYAKNVVNEYAKIVKTISSADRCRSLLSQSGEDAVLSGANLSKQLATTSVRRIVSSATWNCLVKECGHANLFDNLLKLIPSKTEIGSKSQYDVYLITKLSAALENTRKELAQNITSKRTKAEAARQKAEKEKRKKRIITTAISCIVIALILFTISLPSIIESNKASRKKEAIESSIQEVIDNLELKIENQIDDDVIINYSYSEFMGYDTSYKWSFDIKMTMFEVFRKTGEDNQQLLAEILRNCEIIETIFEQENDSFDFEIECDGIEIGIHNSEGAVSFGDLSTYETFYFGGNSLYSRNIEYVLDADYKVKNDNISKSDLESDLEIDDTTEENVTLSKYVSLSGKYRMLVMNDVNGTAQDEKSLGVDKLYLIIGENSEVEFDSYNFDEKRTERLTGELSTQVTLEQLKALGIDTSDNENADAYYEIVFDNGTLGYIACWPAAKMFTVFFNGSSYSFMNLE